ncbi:MAG: NADPH:quinone oxidoreductase family protein [Desulfofustis sp.]|nr:NADPH:quinone oxidoreductase family protein [Desulfofustis sp.]NNK57223.1 NADPH:quinone oxidoreductase family protein [Desulfofustis sp.]
MKGITVKKYGSSDVLEYTDLPDPVPEIDQVLIEVHGASVNYADIKARKGEYHLGSPLPFVPGLDAAGVVLDVGNEVTHIRPGDHVIAFTAAGSYAEKAIASQSLTYIVPKTINLRKAAAAVLVAGTATHMLRYLARIKANESLLIHTAAGGVGSTALQIAKNLGVQRIYGSTGSSWKEVHVKKLGAIGVVDYNSETYARDIIKLTDKNGVDVILNPLGGATIERDLHCLAPFGRLIVFGELNNQASNLLPNALYTSNKTIIGSSFGHFRKVRPGLVRETIDKVIQLLADEQIEMIIDKCFPLHQASQAHQQLEDREVLGKVVLVPAALLA